MPTLALWIGPLAVHVESLTRPPLVPTSGVAELRRLLARLRWRLGLEGLARAAIRGAIASSLALILVTVAVWLTAADKAWLWLAGAPFLASLGLTVVNWPSTLHTAIVADRRLGLEERLSTAVELSQSGRSGRFDRVQIRDAVSQTSSLRATWLVLNRRTRNEALAAVLALTLAFGFALVLPTVRRPVSTPLAASSDVPVAAAPDAAADRSLPVDDTASNPAASVPVRSQATPPADLASRVQQEQAERAALDKLAQGLGSVSAGQAAADAIQQGNFDAAHDQIQSLGDNADQLSDAAKQLLGRGLQQAAAATSQSDRALADREQQAAQALARSNYIDQRQALDALADQVQRSGSRSVPADQLERDQGQLQQQQQLGQSQSAPASQRGQQANAAQADASASDASTPGNQGSQTAPGAGDVSASDSGAAKQGGAGVGNGDSPDPFSNQASRLDTAGQQVQVPTRLGNGAGVRPADGTEDQSTSDPSLGGQSVAEQSQAQQTGQLNPEENLVPGEQRPVVRGYFR
ncbi:MAG: hypothetical protein JOZ87_27480 [Chloroflexi bacterium]|nr:hypothetical protein [Chloroflexota bacterium]